jgi:SNF family Na+-dependent transporter
VHWCSCLFELGLIDLFVEIFNEVGLPLGGLMICLFLGYFWKTENALTRNTRRLSERYDESTGSASFWIIMIKFISPALIALVLITTPWKNIIICLTELLLSSRHPLYFGHNFKLSNIYGKN